VPPIAFSKIGRVRRHARQPVLVDEALQLAVLDQLAGDVVEPDGLALRLDLVEVVRRHGRSSVPQLLVSVPRYPATGSAELGHAVRMDVGDALDELYGLPRDTFVARRAEIVKALRAEKRRDEAKRVAALRKPTLAAWVIDRLARDAPEVLRGAVDAHVALAGDGGARPLREAIRAEREAFEALTAAAARLDGVTEAPVQAIRATLQAAGTDPELRALVLAGHVAAEAEPGTGWPGPGAGVPRPSPTPTSRPKRMPTWRRPRRPRRHPATRRGPSPETKGPRRRPRPPAEPRPRRGLAPPSAGAR
jgi:hypothetical protein